MPSETSALIIFHIAGASSGATIDSRIARSISEDSSPVVHRVTPPSVGQIVFSMIAEAKKNAERGEESTPETLVILSNIG
jgi:hypothetical protein